MTYGLVGRHLKHSFSKMIHESFKKYKYELIEVEPESIDDFFNHPQFNAVNVTIPYKQIAYKHCDVLDDKAKAIGAVNCVVNKDGTLKGTNTDYDGIVYTFDRHKIDLKDKKVLIFGKGGASKAFQAVCKDQGAKEVQVVYYKEAKDTISYKDAYTKYKDADIIINATPVGMFPKLDELSIELDHFTQLEFVFDAIYNPLQTELIRLAKEKQIPCANGLAMLVYQAIKAASFFLGEEVECDAQKLIEDITMSQRNVVLIGMPSAGKSMIGAGIRDGLGLPFYDLDKELEKKNNRIIADIFNNEGEAYFRDLETDIVKQFSGKTGSILSCGGGVILRQENMKYLSLNGTIIYVRRPLENLMRKNADRPVLNQGIENLYNRRKALYESYSNFIVENDSTIARAVDETIHYLLSPESVKHLL